jgi:hypothetical protein
MWLFADLQLDHLGSGMLHEVEEEAVESAHLLRKLGADHCAHWTLRSVLARLRGRHPSSKYSKETPYGQA